MDENADNVMLCEVDWTQRGNDPGWNVLIKFK